MLHFLSFVSISLTRSPPPLSLSQSQFFEQLLHTPAFVRGEPFGRTMPVSLSRVPSAERDVAEATFQAFGRALALAQFEELPVPAYAISPAFWTLFAGDLNDSSQDMQQLCRRLMDCDPLFFTACLHELGRPSGPSASDLLRRVQDHLRQSPLVPLDSIARIREGMMEVLRAAVPPNRATHLDKVCCHCTSTDRSSDLHASVSDDCF